VKSTAKERRFEIADFVYGDLRSRLELDAVRQLPERPRVISA
jgi:hypothetical protein